jgi:hypothetical protein
MSKPRGYVLAQRLNPERADTRWRWSLCVMTTGYLEPFLPRTYASEAAALRAGRRAAAKLGVQLRKERR